MTKPTSNLILFLSADELSRADVFSKSDPFVIVSLEEEGTKREIGRTETINNSSGPKWVTTIPVTYYFERRQNLVFDIRDDDGGTSYDEIGQAQSSLGSILHSLYEGACVLELSNRKNKPSGWLYWPWLIAACRARAPCRSA